MSKYLVMCGLMMFVLARPAVAAEICGNDIDDDGNGMTDEGCAPTQTTGVCESPLSCGDIGMVSWTTGALHYDLPPDVDPKVPFGPGIGFRRFYTSMYAPGTGPSSVNHKPLGERWQHTYMSWIDRFQVGGVWTIVLHTSEGRDVYATAGTPSGGWEPYTPQSGFHVMSIKRNTSSPNQYQVQLLTGETLYYNSSGQLTQIWDNLKTSPNVVTIAWTSTTAGNVSTVTDASGYRRLLFNYTSNLLTSVNYQLLISGTWTTQQTTTYAYTSGALTSVTIGSVLAEQDSYTGGYLTNINDGTGVALATFSWDGTTAGKVDRIDKPNGSVGFEYSSARAQCSGKTIMYFNQANAASCSSDTDCSTVGYLCGGYNGAAGSGRCYFAGRCVTTGLANGESVVTAVAPLSNDHNTCDGACTDVGQYTWSTDPSLLNVTAMADPFVSGTHYRTAIYNANGLPTQITYGDNDSNPSNTPPTGSQTTFISYDTLYPGRIASVSRQSDLFVGAGGCPGVSGACTVSSYTFSSTDGTLQQLQQTGTTLSSTGSTTPYTYTTTYAHDTKGRLTEIDGPVSGMKTTFGYYTATTTPLTYGFLQNYQIYKDATNHVDSSLLSYDFWGNVTGRQDPDGTVSCRTFDSSRNYLTQTREAMAGQTDCTTTNAADLTTSFVRDSALRLTQVTRPDNSCVFYAYTNGRMSTIKRRDDCNSASSGDYQSLSYSPDGQLTRIDTYNAGGTITASRQYTYYDSRRLDTIVNPVDTTKSKAYNYDPSGALIEIDDEASLGRTVYSLDTASRIATEQRYNTSTTYDSWTFQYAWQAGQTQVTDGDSKSTQSARDDLGRLVKLATPDMSYPTVDLYDAAGHMTSKVEGVGGTTSTHTFTFDYAGRPLNDDYATTCWVGSPPVNTPHPEVQRVYDSVTSCPMTGGCNNLQGRLAYVKAILSCSNMYTDDGSLDQETWYSYDAAGRLVEEYIHDDTGRIADHKYTWTKRGELSQVITPASATIAWSFDGSGNSDKDRISSIAVNSANVATGILWYPFGPLQQYSQSSSIGGSTLRTVIARNLAYRMSDIQMQTSASVEEDGVHLTEDAKGRVVTRHNFDTSRQDSYFIYDNEDHVVCETYSSVSSCPTITDSSVRNSHYTSSPFTHAGDWVAMIRWDTTAEGSDVFALNAGTHQLASDYQTHSKLGVTQITYNSLGDRSSDYGTHWNTHHIDRTYTYDARHNVVNVRFEYPLWTGCPFRCTYTWHYADTASDFDAKGRRVFKSVHDETTGWYSNTFFYYDALDRLTEIRFIPDISDATTYTIYQLVWLGQRPVMYYQTDYPSATVSKRYTVTDETDRIVALWSWPATGDSTRVWEVNASAWGDDWPTVGSSVYQPVWFAGQYMDEETRTYLDDGSTIHQRGLLLNGARTYDPYTGGYLQLDPLVDRSRTSYVYVDSNPVGRADPRGLIWFDPEHPGHECADDPGAGPGQTGGDTPPVHAIPPVTQGPNLPWSDTSSTGYADNSDDGGEYVPSGYSSGCNGGGAGGPPPDVPGENGKPSSGHHHYHHHTPFSCPPPPQMTWDRSAGGFWRRMHAGEIQDLGPCAPGNHETSGAVTGVSAF